MSFIKNWFTGSGGNNTKESDMKGSPGVSPSHADIFEKLNAEHVKSGESRDKKSEWAESAEEEDRVEKAIRASGCWPQHLAVVDCMQERRDWRLCQESLSDFKICMGLKSVDDAKKQTPKK